ncbi:cupin domain-containing protein [Alsobacter sp. SYSU M60028]|uniref:Cupin domain-containing protein n=1 Tax=Alsobacter ponti TaxID=2962936 RepID=A0ABT1LAY3_9HYPH|nr:cupin domain-containing protein [Alsobacter ponti]MCP8938640.1 cupin domain-containing protein [Alsobacter ponti]
MPRRDFDPASVTPDGRAPAKARLFTPDGDQPWRGHVHGEAIGGECTVLTYGNDTVGMGPKLHMHPYDETFVVVAGRARFFVGDQVIEAEAGDVVFGPKGLPHRFENLGPGRLQTIDIHHSPRWLQVDL